MTRSTLIVPANNSLLRGGDLREDLAAPRFDSRDEGRLGPTLRTSTVNCVTYESERRTNPDIKTPVGADGRPVCTSAFDLSSITAGKYTLRSAGQLGALVNALQSNLSRPIVDNTGLTGMFEWTLTFAIISEDPAFDTREAES